MHVTKSVHIDNVDIGRREQNVLNERCEHVPGLKEDEAGIEPKAISGKHGEDR